MTDFALVYILGGKKCINTVGSYKCECPSGYREDQNGFCQGTCLISITVEKERFRFKVLPTDFLIFSIDLTITYFNRY